MTVYSVIRIAVASVGGFFAYWLGGFDLLLRTMLALTILDFITGVMTSIYNGTFSSRICTKGVIRKVYIYLTVILANIIQIFMGDTIPIRETVIIFYIVSEGMSSLENIGKVVEYPDKLKQIFVQLKEKEGGTNNE